MINISVIIPIYNTAQYIVRCIESIEKQDLADIEIICIDDCSTDNTLEILNRISEKYSNIVVLRNKINMGLSFTRNIGIKNAKGKYVFFVDSDDWIEENCLKELFLASEENKLDILYFNYIQEYESKNDELLYSSEYSSHYNVDRSVVLDGDNMFVNLGIKGQHRVMAWIGLFRTDFLLSNHILFYNGIIHEDNLFYPDSLLRAERTMTISCFAYRYYRHSGTICADKEINEKRLHDLIIVYTELDKLRHELQLSERCSIEYYKYLLGLNDEIMRSYKRFLAKGISPQLQFEKSHHYIEYLNLTSKLKNRYTSYPTDTKIETIQKYEDVIIYGAGKIAVEVINDLHEHGIDKFHLAVSTIDEKKYLYGNPIKMIDEYSSIKYSALVLIAVSAKFQKEIEENLDKLGFKNRIRMTE